MKRRDFLKAGMAVVGGAIATGSRANENPTRPASGRRFGLKYAPHFGMFKHLAGEALTDQLRFAADQGFTAWEDRIVRQRPIGLQNRIARVMDALGMQMGVFTASELRCDDPRQRSDSESALLCDLRNSVDVARRMNARWMTVDLEDLDATLGQADRRTDLLDLLRRGADIVEPYDLALVLKPSKLWRSRGIQSADTLSLVCEICREIDRPSCKLLFDVCHQYVRGGDVVSRIDSSWDQVAYFQCGDSGGRKEPGTGEIDYSQILRHIQSRRFSGIIGMEHGNSLPGAAGEIAVIDAYLRVDRS